ncbi:unnamed protein product [Rhizophagus irregularis]|nr:unnamed protein product [Rhizophagus irregularis]
MWKRGSFTKQISFNKMSASRKRTKRTPISNQVISTYDLRPRTRSASIIIPPNSSKSPSVQKKQTKRRNSRKKNNVDNTQQLPSERFIMPSPKRFTDDFNELDTDVDFLRLDELELYELELFKDENVDGTSERCPFCNATLPILMSDRLKSASELIKQGKIPASEFCFIHFAEISVTSDGVANNYPSVINFEELPDRIHKLKNNLLEIIDGTADSYYRNCALKYYKKNGRKSASPLGLLNRFEELRAGYYGTKGALIISDVLMKLFLNTHILTSENTAPLKPADYMMEVLIPETAMRLIYEDIGGDGSLETARKILVSSSNFGDWVHNDGDV